MFKVYRPKPIMTWQLRHFFSNHQVQVQPNIGLAYLDLTPHMPFSTPRLSWGREILGCKHS